MKIRVGDPDAHRARVTLDGIELIGCCTFADEEAGCVTVFVRDEETGQLVLEHPECGMPHDADEVLCPECWNRVRVKEITLFGVVRIAFRPVEELRQP